MKLSDLRNFLCGALEARELSRLIQGEVVAFREASLKKGSVMSVILVEDSIGLRFGDAELKVLCGAFLEGQIDRWVLSYICDALLMSNSVVFLEDSIRDSVDVTTDPEVNGEVTEEMIRRIVATLGD